MEIRCKGLSDVGRKRDHNEDRYVINLADRLFAVADGMGGHAAGEVASEIAITTMKDFVRSTRENADNTWPFEYDTTLSGEGNLMRTAIRLANQRICETILEEEGLKDMGTTVVGVLVSADRVATVGHVGDSRAYLIRNGSIRQLTSDHSWVNEQIKLGFLTQQDAQKHPFRNVVTRALGSRPQVTVDLVEQPLAPDDRILLCSDGLNAMLEDGMIQTLITNAVDDLEAACRELISAANGRGGEDNITAVLIHASPE